LNHLIAPHLEGSQNTNYIDATQTPLTVITTPTTNFTNIFYTRLATIIRPDKTAPAMQRRTPTASYDSKTTYPRDQ